MPYNTAAMCLHIDAHSGQLQVKRISFGGGTTLSSPRRDRAGRRRCAGRRNGRGSGAPLRRGIETCVCTNGQRTRKARDRLAGTTATPIQPRGSDSGHGTQQRPPISNRRREHAHGSGDLSGADRSTFRRRAFSWCTLLYALSWLYALSCRTVEIASAAVARGLVHASCVHGPSLIGECGGTAQY